MATTTTNLRLTKPAVSEAADISVLNSNFDKIDALGGYGLGQTVAKLIDNDVLLSDQVTGGMYYWTGSNTDPDKPFTAGEMLVIPRGGAGYVNQIAFSKERTIPEIRVRQQTGDTWSEWDWFNPPMALNVEYRTVKRYLGKPVYTMMIPFGALPNQTSKLVDVNGIGIVDAISTMLVGTDGQAFTWTNHSGVTGVFNTASTVQVYTSSDLSAFKANCILEYTKQ